MGTGPVPENFFSIKLSFRLLKTLRLITLFETIYEITEVIWGVSSLIEEAEKVKDTPSSFLSIQGRYTNMFIDFHMSKEAGFSTKNIKSTENF